MIRRKIRSCPHFIVGEWYCHGHILPRFSVLVESCIEASRILMIFIFAYLPTLSEPPICPRNMKLILVWPYKIESPSGRHTCPTFVSCMKGLNTQLTCIYSVAYHRCSTVASELTKTHIFLSNVLDLVLPT